MATGTRRHVATTGAIVTYAAGAVWVWRRLGSYGVLSRPVLAFMAAGWPGIATGVAVTYAVHVVKGR
jgi:hypothetical protein